MDYDKLNGITGELKEYTELEGSELGEYCRQLIDMVSSTSMMSDEFADSFLQEMENQLNNFKENCVIVKAMRSTCYEHKELEWKQ